MKQFLRFTFFTLLFYSSLSAQDSAAGGFTYGWNNYDQSDSLGLGQHIVEWDTTALRTIVHAPEIGVHPRIFFGPSEIPDIQYRLEHLESGQAVAAQIHAFTVLLQLGYPGYNHNANYGLDTHGNRWIGNAGFWNSQPQYEKLKNEDATVWEEEEIKRKHITSTLMALEAFECLMKQGQFDEDTQTYYDERAEDLARAMAFWASLVIDDPTVNASGNNYNHFGGIHMALAYDLNYHAMTDEQRAIVRQGLAQITPEVPRHGAYLPAFANQSNWSTLNSFEIITNLAIEGEDGYKPALTERWMRAYHNFITYGWYPSGAGYEGLGKNYQYTTTMIAAAKRGYSLLGHPHVRAYANEFLPAITQPFGHGFTSYDVWGGSGYDPETGGYKFAASDIVGLKWMFPNNQRIDYVWRNYIEKSYDSTSEGYVYQQIRPDNSYYNFLIPAAVFCQDYETETIPNQPLDLDYFASDRGLAVFKSDFQEDALAMQFHCRQDLGGHTHGDRNDFTLSALGRVWIRKSFGGSQFQPTRFHSCVLIDGLGIGVGDPDGDKCRQPGTILAYQNDDELSLVAGDATYAYTWEWHWSPQVQTNDHPWLGNDGWEAVTETWNDFQFIPKDEAHYNIPFYDYPHWHQANRYERMVKRPYNTMEKVYRTLAMIRAERPFALVVDDLKKDEEVHQFQWLAQIARDLTIESTDIHLEQDNYRCDIILKEPESTGDRRLLVRILNNEGYDETQLPAIMDTLDYYDYFTGNPYNSNPNFERPRLIVESNSAEPDFKIMLFPFHESESLPITNWNATKDTLEVLFEEEDYKVAFEKNEQGRTSLSLVEEVVVNQENLLDADHIKVFPTLFKELIQLESSLSLNEGQLNLYNVNGQIVQSFVINKQDQNFSVKHLNSGTYFYEIRLDNQIVKTGKLIKQ